MDAASARPLPAAAAHPEVLVPTRSTLFLRTFMPWQLVRFAVINLRMLRLIQRSH